MLEVRRSRAFALPCTAMLVAALPLVAFRYPFHAGDGTRRVQDLAVPPGFERQAVPPGSFPDYLRQAPLLPAGSPVLRFDGQKVMEGSDVAAVLDMPLLDATQQCADSALRYWFEYLHEAGKDDEIQAKLTSGEKVTLARWKADRKRGESDQEVFIRFLKHCMNYVGSYSLSRDLPSVDESDLGPGCLIVQPNPKGGIGHLSMIFDMARNARGERVFLVGYGFLPAQSVFLAKPDAGNGPAATAWFSLEGFQAQHAYLGKTFVYRRFAP